jgi:hypothetical protein
MRLKKVMATGLVAALALSTMVGCSSKKDSSDQKKIGVVQLVEHDALDASYKGFKDGLEKAGYKDGDKIKIEYKNAQNEQSNCQTIAKQFVTDKCDLVLAIATPAAQAMANESKDIPILVTAYDSKLILFRSIAIKLLEKNGIKADETSVLVKDFISCYCRLNIVDEPAEQWRNAEMKRLASLQELMYYGGI